MKKIILITTIIAALFLIPGVCFSWPIGFINAKQGVSTTNCVGKGVATDPVNKDIVITGYFADVAIFDTEKLKSAGQRDIFIARYDGSGSLVWIEQAGGASNDEAYAIAADSLGNSIVVGRFTGTANFGLQHTLTSTSSDQSDIFIAKYDANGDTCWAVKAGGTGNDEAYGIATDSNGNVYVTGRVFNGNSFFDVFIAKYSSAGQVQWETSAGGSEYDEGTGITIDGSDNIVVTGRFTGTAIFGPGETNVTELTSAGGNDYDVFVAKFNPSDGSLIWAKSAGGLGDDAGQGIALQEDKIIVVGQFQGASMFGNMTLANPGENGMFFTTIGEMPFNGDVTGDGRIGLEDAIGILQVLTGLK